ncbi:MAG: ArsR family transcriptional regulator, partial [Natrialbaceae archaeon]
ALANDTRYRLARALVAADGELCVCELHPLVDVSESGVSHAMSSLVQAGLVEGRKEGRWKKYRATDRANALLRVLDGGVDDD